jgi:hypothetical protein
MFLLLSLYSLPYVLGGSVLCLSIRCVLALLEKPAGIERLLVGGLVWTWDWTLVWAGLTAPAYAFARALALVSRWRM